MEVLREKAQSMSQMSFNWSSRRDVHDLCEIICTTLCVGTNVHFSEKRVSPQLPLNFLKNQGLKKRY